MWDQYRSQGLHLFHVETQNHSAEQVESFLKSYGITFPNPILNESEFPLIGTGAAFGWGYDCAKLPRTYVIGVEGTVIWEGRFGYDEVVEQELAKIRYPGLFKQEVARELQTAAKNFGSGKYGKAITEAEQKIARLEDQEAISDAELIIARALEIADDLRGEADEAIRERRYSIAIERLGELATRFKGHDLGAGAAAERTDLEKNPQVKKEIKASRKLEELVANARSSDLQPTALARKLRSFAGKCEGLRAADDALALADRFEKLDK